MVQLKDDTMADYYKEVFIWPGGGEIASIVVDADEFDTLCDDLRGIIVLSQEGGDQKRVVDAQIKALKAARTVPMIGRGKKTEFLFERYDIEQDKMCVIVRGEGKKALNEIIARDQASMN